jgi:hypothetical protein
VILDRLLHTRFVLPIAAFSILVSVLCLARYPAIGGDDVVLASTALNAVSHGSLARPTGNDLWLYTQGDARYAELTGETAMNDPSALAGVSYVIIDERQMTDRLTGLRNYVRSNFRLVAKVSPPFRPLPWAKTPPLDVKMYAREGSRPALK